MHATVRRYEGVDASRTDELTKKVNETLIPKLSKLPGFDGYFLIEAGNDVMTSVSLFDTSAHADESTRVQLGARREAGERASECAEDHLRRGDRAAQDERGRSGISPRLDGAGKARNSRAFPSVAKASDEDDHDDDCVPPQAGLLH